jgi:hypothetical protein
VWVALSNGDGTFQAPRFVLADLGYKSGWRVDLHPRFLADVTGDGRADIIGFGNAGVWCALGDGEGHFPLAQFTLPDFGRDSATRTKVIPLALLQAKFDEFFNARPRPLFRFELHGTTFGQSSLFTYFDDPTSGYRLHGEPKDLGHLEFDPPGLPNPNFHFSHFNSHSITLNATVGAAAGSEIRIGFETRGEEIDFIEYDVLTSRALHGWAPSFDPVAGVVSSRSGYCPEFLGDTLSSLPSSSSVRR